MILLENSTIRVESVVMLPHCYETGREQDCQRCTERKGGSCRSPMGLCAASYPGHPHGCPNYGKKDNCPPGMPAIDEVFDLTRPMYCVCSKFDMAAHTAGMRRRHPGWSERQLACCLYWQAGVRKLHREYAAEVYNRLKAPGFALTDSPEAMGVLVTETLGNRGIALEWPPVRFVYKVSFAGFVKPEVLEAMRIRGREIVIQGNGYLIIKR